MFKTKDFFRAIDLNQAPAVGGPVTDPRDPRALCYFDFAADGQRIYLPAFTATTGRVCISFDDDHMTGGVPALPALPAPGQVEVHRVLLPAGPPAAQDVWYPADHVRRSCRVWLDPSVLPPSGQQFEVHVCAWARD